MKQMKRSNLFVATLFMGMIGCCVPVYTIQEDGAREYNAIGTEIREHDAVTSEVVGMASEAEEME